VPLDGNGLNIRGEVSPEPKLAVSNSIVDSNMAICRFMFTATLRSIVAAPCRLCLNLALCVCCLLCSAALHAQVAQNRTDLEKIHKALTSTEKLRYHEPMVFVGEITALGPVYHARPSPRLFLLLPVARRRVPNRSAQTGVRRVSVLLRYSGPR
jgi:hypothetical protein